MTRKLFEKGRSEESVLIFGDPAVDGGVYHSLIFVKKENFVKSTKAIERAQPFYIWSTFTCLYKYKVGEK